MGILQVNHFICDGCGEKIKKSSAWLIIGQSTVIVAPKGWGHGGWNNEALLCKECKEKYDREQKIITETIDEHYDKKEYR